MAVRPLPFISTPPGGPDHLAHSTQVRTAIVQVHEDLTTLDASGGGSVGVGDIVASGTPSDLTYLRGDGAWATPAGGSGGSGTSVHNDLTGRSATDQHPIGAITGLTSALDGKAATNDPRLSDARTPTAHGHTQGEVVGLTTALAGKVGTSDPRLSDERTPTAHTHAAWQVTDLAAAVHTELGKLHVRYAGSWPNRPNVPATVVVTWVKPSAADPNPSVGGTGMAPNDVALLAQS